jgi:hypothetical protein
MTWAFYLTSYLPSSLSDLTCFSPVRLVSVWLDLFDLDISIIIVVGISEFCFTTCKDDVTVRCCSCVDCSILVFYHTTVCRILVQLFCYVKRLGIDMLNRTP